MDYHGFGGEENFQDVASLNRIHVECASFLQDYNLYGHEILSTFTFLGLINLKRVRNGGHQLDH